MSRFLEALRAGPLLADGAMGTQLQQAGLEPGGCGEAWNVDAPDKVLAIQRAYVEAGCDVLLTNTFGASRVMLERHGEGARVAAINAAGVRVAREAFGDRPGFVVGDLGPFGGLLEPLGDVPAGRVRDAFREQARALVEAGADAIVVETQTALEELALGIQGARAAGAPALVGSMAFDRTFDGEDARTMMGVAPEDAARFMVEHGVDVVGLNCGTGIDMRMAADVVARYRATCDLPVWVKPNAGQPELVDMQVVYNETPDEMASGVALLVERGARVLGGCCGSTPDHLRRFRQELDALANGDAR